MRILDRYILKHIIYSYLFTLLVFIGLYFIIDVFSNLSDILNVNPPFLILIQYYLNSLPLIILRVSPLSILISTLYTFGELNKNNEIVSFRASGLSIIRISLPVIFFTLLISSATFFMQEKLLIHSQRKVEEIKTRYLKGKITAASEEKNLAFTSGQMIFFARKFIPKDKVLQNVIIFEEDENRIITKKIICKKIVFEYGFWIAEDTVEYNLDGDGNIVGLPVSLAKKKIDLKEKPGELVLKRSIYSQFLSLDNLRKEMRRLKKIKANKLLANLTVDFHQKMAEPFSHLFLVIGILPLALEIKKRKAALSTLGIGFFFGFIYFVLFSFSIALGKSGIILPFLAAWITPLFFLTVGITGLLLLR